MQDDAPTTHDRLSARIVELETLYTHLQKTLGELDQVVLGQQRQIEALERKIAAVNADLGAVARSVVDDRRPEDEKPPHY